MSTAKIEAVLPGRLQEYDLIDSNNKCQFVRETKFHTIGEYALGNPLKRDLFVLSTLDLTFNLR